jgi:hypothetical protein
MAVQASGMRFVIQPRPPHMRRRRVIEEFFRAWRRVWAPS